MKGGGESPMVNSPYNKYRKKITLGDGPPRTFDRKPSGSASTLQRMAMQNSASSKTNANTGNEAFSPQRPKTLTFEEEEEAPMLNAPNGKTVESKKGGNKIHPETNSPELYPSPDNDIPPPPMGPPPSP